MTELKFPVLVQFRSSQKLEAVDKSKNLLGMLDNPFNNNLARITSPINISRTAFKDLTVLNIIAEGPGILNIEIDAPSLKTTAIIGKTPKSITIKTLSLLSISSDELSITDTTGVSFPRPEWFAETFKLKMNNANLSGTIPDYKYSKQSRIYLDNNPGIQRIPISMCQSGFSSFRDTGVTIQTIPDCFLCYYNANPANFYLPYSIKPPVGYSCDTRVSKPVALKLFTDDITVRGSNFGWGQEVDNDVNLDIYNSEFIITNPMVSETGSKVVHLSLKPSIVVDVTCNAVSVVDSRRPIALLKDNYQLEIDHHLVVASIEELDAQDIIHKQLLSIDQVWETNKTLVDGDTLTTYSVVVNETTSVVISIRELQKALNGTFAGTPFTLPANSIKVSVNISNWVYRSGLNNLRVVFQTAIDNDALECGEAANQVTKDNNEMGSFQLVQSGSQVRFHGKFLVNMMSDGREQRALNTKINVTNGQLFVGTRLPYCSQCYIDPNLSLLVKQSYADSKPKAEVECPSQPKSILVIVIAAVVCSAVVISLVVASVLLYRKRIAKEQHREQVRQRLENEVEVVNPIIERKKAEYRAILTDKIEIEKRTFEVQSLLIDNCISEDDLKRYKKTYKYHISVKDQKVYDQEELSNYCSTDCLTKSKLFRSTLDKTPVYLRKIMDDKIETPEEVISRDLEQNLMIVENVDAQNAPLNTDFGSINSDSPVVINDKDIDMEPLASALPPMVQEVEVDPLMDLLPPKVMEMRKTLFNPTTKLSDDEHLTDKSADGMVDDDDVDFGSNTEDDEDSYADLEFDSGPDSGREDATTLYGLVERPKNTAKMLPISNYHSVYAPLSEWRTPNTQAYLRETQVQAK
eukprot:gene5629-6493_t